MGAEAAWCRRSARCWRWRRRWRRPVSSRRSASPFSGGRARRRRERAREVDRFSLAAMFVPGRAVPAGRHPARLRDRCAGAGRRAAAGRRRACRCRPAIPWLSIVPVAESRSSYNGLLVFVFIAISASLAAFAMHRFASRARAPRPGLGLRLSRLRARRPNTPPAASPSRSGACSARWCSARARASTCRRPAISGRRGFASSCAISIWDVLYAPIAGRGRLRRRAAQRPAVPDHPPLSQPGLRRPWSRCCWCWRYGRDLAISPSRARR